MKRIIVAYLLFMCIVYCYGQHRNSPESEKRIALLDRCWCPNQTFNTDSVYSFFQSSPFKSIEKENVFFEVEDEPIPYDSIFKKVRKVSLLNFLESLYRDDNNKTIPFPTLLKMLLAASDSTTQYTIPIKRWNAAELGEEWVTHSNQKYYNRLLDERMQKANKKEYKNFRRTMDKVNVPVRIRMSIPVFDEEYKYAFLILRMDEDYAIFALFERQENEWNPILVSKGKKTWRMDNSF